MLMLDGEEYIYDPGFSSGDRVSELLDTRHIEEVEDRVLDEQGFGAHPQREEGGTSHISVMDMDGNIVTLTETIECFMGSGVSIEGTGILMNDELHDFDYNLSSKNVIEGGKRPRSSMSPTIVFKDGRPMLVLGASGGTRIVSSLLQVLFYRLVMGLSLASAIFMPRLHYYGGKVFTESRLYDRRFKDLDVVDVGSGLNPNLEGYSLYMGAVEAIEYVREGIILGVSDPRKQFGAVLVE
jgi:gamma-glutamyltranspeptidase/glutathione hydrolase